jgi:hypothetical protein
VRNLQQYTDWMKGLLTFIPDGRYELKSFVTDEERQNVSAYGIFMGTHTGQGGPYPRTGKSLKTLRVRDVLRWRQDQAYAEDLARWPGDEGPRVVLSAADGLGQPCGFSNLSRLRPPLPHH